MRFDWYQVTLLSDLAAHNPEGVLRQFASALNVDSMTPATAQWGYGSQLVLRRDGEVIMRGMYGGTQTRPTVWASGSTTPEFVDMLRSGMHPHWVTRADSALDVQGPGAWDRLSTVALELADERNLKVSQAGDWHRGVDGRTLYIGSRSSNVFVRLYEKGKQLKQAGAADWVRCEALVRPTRAVRVKVASMGPEEVWGLSVWTRELLERIDGEQVPRVTMRTRAEGSDQRALDVMVHQYAGPMGRTAQRLGGWEALGRMLEQMAS